MRSTSPSTASVPIAPRRGFFIAASVMLTIAVTAMVVLHRLQPELSVLHQPLSFYVHGNNGWLFPLALGSFAGSAIAMGVGMRQSAGSAAASRWLIGFAAGMLVDAIVPSDPWFPWEGDYSIGGLIHAASAVLAPPLLIGAMSALRRSRGSKPYFPWRSLNVLALAYVLGLAASGVSLMVGFINGRSPPLIGLGERFLALAAVAWLALVARTWLKRSSPTYGGDLAG